MEVIKMTSDEAKATLVDFLKTNRIDQKEFAEMIGKSEVTISRWLNSDKPLSASNINAIQFILWSHAKKNGIKNEEKRPGDNDGQRRKSHCVQNQYVHSIPSSISISCDVGRSSG